MRLLFNLILLFILTVNYTYASAVSDFADEYLKKLESQDRMVFVSDCCDGIKEEEVVLIMVPASNKGLIIEYSAKEAVNLGEIDFGEEFCFVSETQGGVHSYSRMKELCEKLSNGKFIFIKSFNLNEYTNRCLKKKK